MTKTFLLVVLVSTLFQTNSFAQEKKYWVFFKNKSGVTFNPFTYFDAKAIERRIINHVNLIDSTDFAVNTNYITDVSTLVDSISYSSRWFNALAVYASGDEITKASKLPFVNRIEPIQRHCLLAKKGSDDFDTTLTLEHRKILEGQISSMNGKTFSANKLDGKDIRIAILDGGFPTVDVNPAFEHIRKRNGIIKTWDFVKKKDFVYAYNMHGCEVMSCVGGIVKGKQIGLATGADFLLARTEINREPFSEEENWLAAMEWADKNGADIINSSLGYITDRYFPEDMNGHTSLVSRAATMAARKGILVVNAAGNEGDNEQWKIIGAPADADSILSVGGVDPETGLHTFFSSYGPTADKRMKPNVCAYGHVIATSKDGLTKTQGTSFSSPLVAGFAACALQSNHSLTNMQLLDEIQKSASLYPYFDYAHGYGIPQANYFTNKVISIAPATFTITQENGELKIAIKDEFLKNDYAKNSYFFYNISDLEGHIEKYYVLSVNQSNILTLPLNEITGKKLNAFYEGFFLTWQPE